MTTPYAMSDFLAELERLGACDEAVEWVKTQPDPQTAWRNCERGDQMLWLAAQYAGPPWSDGRRKLVLAACGCARLALPIFERRVPQDSCVRECLDLHERWGRGEEVSRDDLRVARRVADAAYADAAASAAAYAAAAAAYAASAASAAAAAYAAAYAERARVLSECADIVRQHYPEVPR